MTIPSPSHTKRKRTDTSKLNRKRMTHYSCHLLSMHQCFDLFRNSFTSNKIMTYGDDWKFGQCHSQFSVFTITFISFLTVLPYRHKYIQYIHFTARGYPTIQELVPQRLGYYNWSRTSLEQCKVSSSSPSMVALSITPD